MPGRRPSRRRARPVQDGQPRQHPQEPVKRRYRLTGLLHYPDPPPLSPLAIQSRVIEIAYRDASASTPSTVQKVGETVSLSPDTYLAKFQGFDDPLTRYVGAPQETDWVRIRAKSLGEFAAYRQILKAESALPSSYTDFEKLLTRVHSRLGTGLTTFRTGPAFIVPDWRGNVTEFPPAAHCRPLLAGLHAFLSERIKQDPALCSLVAYATLIYVHPFSDGNGRTARVVYNLVNAFGLCTPHFLPIYTCSSINSANFLIRLRRAYFGHEWLSLQEFFRDALTLSIQLQSDACTPHEHESQQP